MKTKDDLSGSFIDRLRKIERNGFQADRKHLKCNMYTQFSDPFEFAREYVVNSYDAGATDCCISGRETISTVTVTIQDNGSGMSLTRLKDYFKIFRSRKDDNGVKAVGRFGVGKLSVAAVPGLLRFAGITSTGTECWRFETDSLIDDQPVTLEKIEPVPTKGTKFEITFKKEQSLKDLLEKIYKILYRYVRHLEINIWFDLPVVDKEMNPLREKLPVGNWLFDYENLGKSYSFPVNGVPVEVVMGLGTAEHEIYQNKVYVTSQYNLISFQSRKALVPNLKIRVNSEVFHLTFGRHCLSDEQVLYNISETISGRILPDYFNYLRSLISEDFIIQHLDLVVKIEEMTIGLIDFRPGNNAWCNFKIFRAYGRPRLSFSDLSEEIRRSGVIYSEAKDNEGADYSMFNGPVLMNDQPAGAFDLIKKMFASSFVNLNEADVVIEAPFGSTRLLSPEEKLFESYLVFKPKEEVINRILDNSRQEKRFNQDLNREKFNAAGICEEARIAGDDFNSVLWKVNYLVERDGVTPCYSRRFLYNNRKIILNLYHPEIRKFIELSFVDPELSAHWALAMCLSDMKLLPHITPDAREDLLLIDAMSRLDGQLGMKAESRQNKWSSMIDFQLGLTDSDIGF